MGGERIGKTCHGDNEHIINKQETAAPVSLRKVEIFAGVRARPAWQPSTGTH